MIVDLFAGPGGWDHGLREYLGIGDVVGVELDDNCVATRCEANLFTYQGDVAKIQPRSVAFPPPIEGLIGSPPCQPFSRAGKRDGMRDLIRLGSHVPCLSDGDVWSMRSDSWSDERAPLILEPLRWVNDLEPTWIALEQVPPCLPMWEVIGEALELFGYNVWTGILNAADYGVPQTRQRAFLMAHRGKEVSPPVPTHAENPGMWETGWVTMSEALNWRASLNAGNREHSAVRGPDEPAPTMAFGNNAAKFSFVAAGETGQGAPRDPDSEPAATITGKGTAYWTRNDQTDSGEVNKDWPDHRPATTVAGRDLIADPGANANRHNGKQKSRNDGVRVSPEQAGVLQGFPADYPWQGSKTAKFSQIGDAVPPPLAAHVVGALMGIKVGR